MSAGRRRQVIERAATEVFAEHGYKGASIDEIARRSGVTPPVVYDHFDSKADLHRGLLERHYEEMRAVWREHLARDTPQEERVPQAVDAWFAYVESHPYATRMIFRDASGEPEVQAFHEEIKARSRAALVPMWAREPGAEMLGGEAAAHEPVLALLISGLQGLALWWSEHPEVPRERMVAIVMNTLWVGFDRARRGEVWTPPDPPWSRSSG